MSYCKQCVYSRHDKDGLVCARYPGILFVKPEDSCGDFASQFPSHAAASNKPNPEDAVTKRICDVAKAPGYQGGLDLLCSSLALLVLRAQRGPR